MVQNKQINYLIMGLIKYFVCFRSGVYNLLLLPAALLLLVWSTAANEFEVYFSDAAKCQHTQNTF